MLDMNNSAFLELVDDLSMYVVRIKYGTDIWYQDTDGTARLRHDPEDYYIQVYEEIGAILKPYINEVH